MEDSFDYIDFIQNKKLQRNLQEYEEKDAPEDVLGRVRDFARTAADPNLGKDLANSAFDESPYDVFDPDPVGTNMDFINRTLEGDGWVPVPLDEDGCLVYQKPGLKLKISISED